VRGGFEAAADAMAQLTRLQTFASASLAELRTSMARSVMSQVELAEIARAALTQHPPPPTAHPSLSAGELSTVARLDAAVSEAFGVVGTRFAASRPAAGAAHDPSSRAASLPVEPVEHLVWDSALNRNVEQNWKARVAYYLVGVDVNVSTGDEPPRIVRRTPLCQYGSAGVWSKTSSSNVWVSQLKGIVAACEERAEALVKDGAHATTEAAFGAAVAHLDKLPKSGRGYAIELLRSRALWSPLKGCTCCSTCRAAT
jgi:hypothetical protein